ncbi:hypothetical protein D3C80_955260 [compost metagenome]
MVKVLSAPPLIFTCSKCGATCQGEEKDFKPLHTLPPLWRVRCGYCNLDQDIFVPALSAKLVGSL